MNKKKHAVYLFRLLEYSITRRIDCCSPTVNVFPLPNKSRVLCFLLWHLRRKYSTCFTTFFVSHQCINTSFFQKTRLTNVSLKHTMFSSSMSFCLSHVLISSSHCKFGTLAVAFHQVVISRLSACCSLDWHPAYQLYGTASSHIITISVCPWVLTNAVGHRTFVNFCKSVSVYAVTRVR